MPSIWEVFGIDELQERIGHSTLDQLGLVLPAVDPELTSEEVFAKRNLARIFEAFRGADAMANSTFRREFYDHLPPQRMRQLAIALDWPDGLGFSETVERLLKHGWSDPSFCGTVASVLGLPEYIVPTQQEVIPALQVLHAASRPFQQLKPYQARILEEAVTKARVQKNRFIIQMPTGSGKTRTAMELIASLINHATPGQCVVWLAHSGELCEQAMECFKEIWSHLGRHEVHVARMWGQGGSIPENAEARCFVIGTFQKWYGVLGREAGSVQALAQRCVALFVDEAHKVIAPTYESVARAIMAGPAILVGLTATPGRGAVSEDENEALAEFFFRQIVTIDAGEESAIGYLRGIGVLAYAEYVPLRASTTYALTASERQQLERTLEFPEGFLRRLGQDQVRNVEIVRRLRTEIEAGRQVLFFACSVEHSQFICAILLFLGLKVAHLDGKTSTVRRSEVVRQFRKGELQVLCNYGVLATGFDVPKLDVVFISRPTGSVVLYSQMVGRGLRGPEIGGKEECRIVDVRDNIQGYSDHDRMYSYFEEYFQPRSQCV